MNNSTTTTDSGKILIGSGNFGWSKYERISDRYGTVMLYKTDDEETDLSQCGISPGTIGSFLAVVTKTQPRNHIGDFSKNLPEIQPHINDEVILGTGELFFEDNFAGLKPDDGRSNEWLDVEQLYKIENQVVSLYFIPAEQ